MLEILKASENADRYFVISNGRGKKWAFGTHNIDLSLALYEPTSFKGKLVKKLVAVTVKTRIAFLTGFIKSFAVDERLLSAVKETFGTGDQRLYFSVFEGSPGVHKKAVVQICSGNEIIGYCKISDSDKVYNLFNREKKILDSLNLSKMSGIPAIKGIDKIDDSYLLFQTTSKTEKSGVPGICYPEINLFLSELAKKTEARSDYKETELYSNLHTDFSSKVSEKFLNKYTHYLEIFDSRIEDNDRYTIAHRDFVPWNTCYERDKLFVFDWEYASEGYLPMTDLFHYYIQSLIIEKNRNAKQIYDFLMKNWDDISSNIKKTTDIDPYLILLSYLLDIISLYVSRSDSISPDEKESVDIRMNLIELIIEKI